MPVPPGTANLVTVNWFSFCQIHGEEQCYRCTYDFRFMNNTIIQDELEEGDSVYLSDERASLNVYGQGAVKTNAKDADGEPKYKCSQHGTIDCTTCFDWKKILLDEIREKQRLEKWLNKRKKWLDKIDP